MEVIRIKAENIDIAAEKVIGLIKEINENVTYLHGWHGLGASVILKEVAKRLKLSLLSTKASASSTVIGLDKVIHIDCTLWQSKRDLQKLIVKDLNLGSHVMAMFDKCDEEDDFDGVEPSVRGVILDVKKEIFEHLKDTRFLVIFHNGSNSNIDLWECGLPILDFMNNRVLWTSHGRFHLFSVEYPGDEKKLARLSKVAISIDPLESDSMATNSLDGLLIQADAEEVATYTGTPEPYMSPKIVMECILYTTLRGGSHGIDWATHAPNCWVCDGIIQTDVVGDRSAWEISRTVNKIMHTDDWHHYWLKQISEIFGEIYEQWRHKDRWVFATHENMAIVEVPPHATSFFMIGESSSGMKNKATTKLEASIFRNSNNLRVLHLSYCTFSFSSPPFRSCSNLRFLLLDHCTEKDKRNHDGAEDDLISYIHDDGSCFEKLWVLEMNYTYWYFLLSEKMMDLMANLKELNVKGVKNWSISHLRPNCGSKSNSNRLLNLQKVHVTVEATDICSKTNQASPVVASLDMSCSIALNTIVLENCAELNHILLKGCTQLKSLLLRGLFEGLVELDMSGTATETLDLSSMQSFYLRRLFLLGCDKLRAILWPQESINEQIYLEVLRIDTTNAPTMAGEGNATIQNTDVSSVQPLLPTEHVSGRAHDDMDSYIFLKDARLLRSLRHIGFDKYHLHVEISSTIIIPGGHKVKEEMSSSVGGGKQQVRDSSIQRATSRLYADSIVGILEDNSQAPCPEITQAYPQCYIAIQDETPSELMRGTRSVTLPELLLDSARKLHLHDSLSITSIPGPGIESTDRTWRYLRHCKLERCPNLDGPVFNPPLVADPERVFWCLKTFWASHLQKAHCIWDWRTASFRPAYRAFEYLEILHLDSCPRLEHVLPLYTSNYYGCRSLEILEIVRCGGLREVFPLDFDSEKQEPRQFPNLKRIHLHELPTLQRICGDRMSAPELETVKIRGCWSLRRLPAVGSTRPSVDCEKEWWDALKWDGVEVGHHPSLYKPSHAKYYKKTLLRKTVLR